MSLTVNEALERVVRRLEPILEKNEQPFGLSCSGTDVPGGEVQARFGLDLHEFNEAVVRYGADAAPNLFVGFLARAFWLGFEFGKAED